MSDALAAAMRAQTAALVELRLDALERVLTSLESQRKVLLSSSSGAAGLLGDLNRYLRLPGPELEGMDLQPAQGRLSAAAERYAELMKPLRDGV